MNNFEISTITLTELVHADKTRKKSRKVIAMIRSKLTIFFSLFFSEEKQINTLEKQCVGNPTFTF